MVKITFPNGDIKEYPESITVMQVAEKISQGLAREAVCAKVDGTVVDMSHTIAKDCTLSILKFSDPEGKEVFWHSGAHLLAQAITRVFPDATLTIGPTVEDGFYYDIDIDKPFTPEDILLIEHEMQNIVEENLKIERVELVKAEAKKLFSDNPYKLELIENFEGTITAYMQGEFIDLCRGPHVPRTGMLRSFKVTKLSAAYWRADSKNKQLQRVYGIVFPEKKMLDAHVKMLEDAEKRNHRKIGEDMELFALFDLIGKGLPVWLPKGEIIRQEIENFALDTEKRYGYQRVATPNLAKKELFIKSGHLPYYEDSMYPAMVMDDGTYYLKAMNCPLHHLIYSKRPRSYRELPLRLAEYGTCYRNELSGTLSGLQRVRILRMNDAHIYCTKEQIESEVESVLTMIKYYYSIFGINEYSFRLSKGSVDNKEKYIDEPENWAYAESVLRNVLVKLNLKFTEADNEAAFYGPKIDVQLKNVYGKEDTVSTVQLDFAAKKRFELHYVDNEGKLNNDVFVIHRAPLSTHERFMAFLIEHFEGKFPLWMAPEQVRVMTIADRHQEFAEELCKTLRANDIRAESDHTQETMPKKVRNAQMDKVPYMITVGDKEVENKTLAVRTLDGKVQFGVKSDDFVKDLTEKIRSRAL